MRLKLFKKYFFTTTVIIFVSLSIMMLIISVLLNNYITRQQGETLTKACNEVAEFISDARQSEALEKADIKSFFNVVRTVSNVADADIFIADSKGNVGVCSCADWEADGSCIHTLSRISDKSIAKSNRYGIRLSTLGIYDSPYYVTSKPLNSKSGEAMATIYATSPTSSVRDLLLTITKLYLLSAVIPIIIMFFAIYAITYRMTKPLKLMSEASKAMARGDFSRRIPVTSDDEIGELSAAFNMMTNSLAQLEGMRKSFVANVSHELKTPMTTIGGFIDGILDGTIEYEKQEYYLTIVSDEVKRLSRLVQSMLSMSKLESGEFALKPELFDMSEMVCTIAISQEQRIEAKNLSVVGLDTLRSVSITADKDLIYQAIYNLVDNAIKFAPDGGEISFALIAENHRVRFSVGNTGEAIPKKDLPFVFERFYKVDKSRSDVKNSTGLGLYIVKTIVSAHGGKISVTSTEGDKTVFCVELPDVK